MLYMTCFPPPSKFQIPQDLLLSKHAFKDVHHPAHLSSKAHSEDQMSCHTNCNVAQGGFFFLKKKKKAAEEMEPWQRAERLCFPYGICRKQI